MAGFSNDIMYADNVNFAGGKTATVLTNGELLIGDTSSPHIKVGTITSPDSSVTIGYSSPNITLIVSGSTVGKTITGNTGGALSPVAGNWNIFAASTSPGTNPVSTAGSGNTLTVNVQKSQAIAAADITKVGLSNFDSASFSVAATGFVTLVQKAQVIAYLNTGLANATGDGTNIGPLIFDTTLSNIGSAYSTGTGIFTAPVTGNYLVCVNVCYNNLIPTHTEGEILFDLVIPGVVQKVIFNPGLNGTAITGYTPGTYTAVLSGVVHMTAAQQFQINTIVNGGTKTVGIQGGTFATDTSLSIVQL